MTDLEVLGFVLLVLVCFGMCVYILATWATEILTMLIRAAARKHDEYFAMKDKK